MNKKLFEILVVEDEQLYAEGIIDILQLEGYACKWVASAELALDALLFKPYGLVLTDLMLGGMTGLELLKQIKERYPSQSVILMTAYATVKSAVEAMKLGAMGYYVKGNQLEELIREVQAAYEMALESTALASEPEENIEVLMYSENAKFNRLVNLAKRAAASPASILLLGESGVGKDVMARYIHQMSSRSAGQLVAVNCQALSEQVLESELFGHVKGAFTGAYEDRMGRFELADKGTLFLDEIADVSLSTQVKLLRTIENKTIEAIGSNQSKNIDFRLVTATNKDLLKLIKNDLFREDFYYRISTIVLELPPLRERREDVERLLYYFVNKTSEVMGIEKCKVLPEVLKALNVYDFPGNIRELKNMAERMVIFSMGGLINLDVLEMSMSNLQVREEQMQDSDDISQLSLRDYRAKSERDYLKVQLEKYSYHLSQTAEAIGITRRQLFNKMKALGLDRSFDLEE